ncbi:RYamide receptor-like [Oppia nitens]|uniref:RYamide receptor-like n=1 Tax=Oppia nitens TaxID=1686743 RepID=UPI0023DBDEF1|nr:RYamide receptor-like [Oppia nitens]
MDPLWYVGNNISLSSSNIPALEALSFWPYQVLLIGLYSTTALISLSFNVVTILVLVKGDRLSSELWKFLVNLSAADITMATFSIPFTYTGFMLGRWIFPTFLCPIVQFVQLLSVFVSVWTLTAIGFDRYFAIVYPFRSLLWLRRHKLLAISMIWLVGSTLASSQLVKSKAEPFPYRNHVYYDCREDWDETAGRFYTVSVFMATFLVPIVALTFVYTKIGVHIVRHAMPGNPDRNRDVVRVNRKIKVIKMLSTVVLLFAVCWLPIHIFSLVVYFYPAILNIRTKYGYNIYVFTYFFCHWISQFHSLVNPVVYCFMSDNFRNSLRSLIQTFFNRLKTCETNPNTGDNNDNHNNNRNDNRKRLANDDDDDDDDGCTDGCYLTQDQSLSSYAIVVSNSNRVITDLIPISNNNVIINDEDYL